MDRPCEERGCIALATHRRTTDGEIVVCAVHARDVTKRELDWLDYMNYVPDFRSPLLLLARRDPRSWLDRYEKKTA